MSNCARLGIIEYMEEVFNVREAAKVLRISPRTVQKQCKILEINRFGKYYMLTIEDIENIRKYMQEHPRGNPNFSA